MANTLTSTEDYKSEACRISEALDRAFELSNAIIALAGDMCGCPATPDGVEENPSPSGLLPQIAARADAASWQIRYALEEIARIRRALS